MFESEYAIEVQSPGGEKLSFFADKSLVRELRGKTYLEVDLVPSKDPDEETVLLPNESFEKGSRWLSAPTGRLALA